MTRCPLCPCPLDLPCPAIAGIYRAPVPRYCDQLAVDPGTWGPEILRTAERDTSGETGREDREVAGIVAQLTETMKAEIRECPNREERMGCCGPYNVCSLGYFDGASITTIHCAKCRVESRPMARV